MSTPRRPPLTKREAATLAFLRGSVRKDTNFPTLQTIATGLGVTTSAAKNHVDSLIRKGFLERVEGAHARTTRIADEPQIPVVTGARLDPRKSLVSESRIVETMRGVLAETFKPEPTCFVLVETRPGHAELLAVRCGTDAPDGACVVGRIRDEIVTGTVVGEHIEITAPISGSDTIRIERADERFRLEGVVVGTVTARSTPLDAGRRQPGT